MVRSSKAFYDRAMIYVGEKYPGSQVTSANESKGTVSGFFKLTPDSFVLVAAELPVQ